MPSKQNVKPSAKELSAGYIHYSTKEVKYIGEDWEFSFAIYSPQ